MESDDRPQPEALLEEAAREHRGRLKIFLGAAPGVGKTYAMLEDAQRRRKEGADIVIGIVESHGRQETEALMRGLEAIPRRLLSYRGRLMSELDLDAVLARRPALVLVDELAHTNVPGSRHEKRYQDVAEILDAGIDVLTTMNVQHLESLNDVVARITRIRVRETLPDKVLELADEIELIDLPPDELIQRLRAGKVYLRDQAHRAVNHFFSRGNLTALRELALRAAAERVDSQMISYMRAHAIPGPWPTSDRLLVCIDAGPAAEALVRAAKRTAERQRIPWIALHVLHEEQMDEPARDRLAAAMHLAEQLGGETVVLPSEADAVSEILHYAAGRNVTCLMVGRPRKTRLFRLRASVTERLARRGGDYDVIIVSAEEKPEASAPLRAVDTSRRINGRDALIVTGVVTASSALAFVADFFLDVPNLSLIFLTGVLLVAIRLGLWPSILASLLSFFAYNFFFTVPYHTFAVHRTEDLLTIFFFLVVATLTGNLAGRLRERADSTRQTARRIGNLYEFSRRAASAAEIDDVAWAVVSHVSGTLQCQSVILLPKGIDGLEIAAGFPPEDHLTPGNWAAAKWAWQHDKPAGWSSETLPGSDWLFLPMDTPNGPVGLVGVCFAERDRPLSTEQRRLLSAVVDQAALAVERTNLARDIEEKRLLTETESLRAALLSSISHDLRTPLVSIIGSASSLQNYGERIPPAQRGELLETIQDEAERLNRFVQNLLDMTRLGYGALTPKRDWIDLRDVVGRARERLKKPLADFAVSADMPDTLPLLHADAVLLEQVMVNLLDNAAKYAPPGTAISIAARPADGMVELRVSDRGPGIPPADREAVFDMFYRVRNGDREKAGTGLGLAICRGIVEAHGGSIRVEDGPGGTGTALVVILPVPAAPAGAGEAE
ncbi:MAG: sensor histidine kinase KdpD [Alphaproteobacteria bacterium]|nr:sensor histidine kinase KdpD [Alphaproteobacteria bacterium]MBU0796031.1 sensor histidine kinase KdpD [Alphaproteobacteria bacterium]MBU0886834.1 sensor histidine kinase KdpD [Alphaproteobacteria bacterium]MBU1812424.1 sensor histidine kinase KdpD [Alphaproteobacteria bacterium]